MKTTDERLQALEIKLDFIIEKIDKHLEYHKSIPERVAVLESQRLDSEHAGDARFQKALVTFGGIITVLGSIFTGLVVHFLHI